MNELRLWQFAVKHQSYQSLAKALASSPPIASEILTDAIQHDESFADAMNGMFQVMAEDRLAGSADLNYVTRQCRRSCLLADQIADRFVRLAQELIGNQLCELFQLPEQNRIGFEWNPWTDEPADTHFDWYEINEVAA